MESEGLARAEPQGGAYSERFGFNSKFDGKPTWGCRQSDMILGFEIILTAGWRMVQAGVGKVRNDKIPTLGFHSEYRCPQLMVVQLNDFPLTLVQNRHIFSRNLREDLNFGLS